MLQNKLYMECIEIDIETLMVKEARTANRRLAKKRVQCLNEALCFVSSSVLADSLVLRNPLLRQAPKRQAVKKLSFLLKNIISQSNNFVLSEATF